MTGAGEPHFPTPRDGEPRFESNSHRAAEGGGPEGALNTLTGADRLWESAALFEPTLRGTTTPGHGESPASPGEELPSRKKGKAQATILVELVDSTTLFVSDNGRPYATVPSAGHRETLPLHSRGFRIWLARKFYQLEGRAPGAQAVQDAIVVLSGMAQFSGPTFRVHTRLALSTERIYLDLGNNAWEAIEVTPDGWQVIAAPPVKFRRPRGLLPIPTPRAGGSIDELRWYLNLPPGHEHAWRLLVGWLLGALRPSGPYPILVLHGEQGSAKSTAARIVRSLIDPSAATLRSIPKDERDLMIAANANWVLAFDNVSHLSPALSDALCRLSTGGGLSTRELYTDEDEVIFDAQRPVILNGIEEIATREDLLDRAMIIRLPPIARGARRPEADLWRDFEAARPRILGALLDSIVVGLRELPRTSLTDLPRMADFAVWVTATESDLGWPSGAFLGSYAVSREAANDLALESSPVAHLLLELVEAEGSLELTATELLEKLALKVEERVARQRTWPSNGKALSGVLHRLGANFRNVGLQVTFLPRRGKARLIRLERLGEQTSPASPSSSMESPLPQPIGPGRPPGDESDGRDEGASGQSDHFRTRVEEMFG